MRLNMIARLVSMAAVVRAATWTSQSPAIPQFEWVVVDHAGGNSMGYGVTIADGHAFVSGSMKRTVRVENPATGEFVESTDEGSDGDIYLAKVSLEGSPTDVWIYFGSSNEFPAHLATSRDETFISMTGYFSGNISFVDYTFTNFKDPSSRMYDGFVVKVASADGNVAWARHFPSDAGTTCAGTSFDASGNVVVVGRRCAFTAEAMPCLGFVTLLANADGSTIWERDFGDAIQSLVDVVAADDGNFYLVGQLLGTAVVDSVTITSATDLYSDAVLLVLDSAGDGAWGATITGHGSARSSLVEFIDGTVYMNCLGSCTAVSSTASTTTASLDGIMSGGVAKLSAEGVPLWGADIPFSLGMGVTSDAVYINYYGTGSQTYGDTTFTTWGSWDHYIVKIDGATGAGQWVLQTGGHGLEYVRRMAVDPNGDLYSVGLTHSQPAYFDPWAINSHNSSDGYDVFLAKLKTSEETVPACKTDATTVADGKCFVNNVCYDEGEQSRAILSTCMVCTPSVSQTSFTITVGHCYIDGVCYADGYAGSACQYCDPSISSDSWTLRADEFSLAADGSCVALKTWTTQSAVLPPYEWVVIDHGDGFSYPQGVVIVGEHVFAAGGASGTVVARNTQTGASLNESVGGVEWGLFISKTGTDGTPEAIWTYPVSRGGAGPGDLAAAQDGSSLALVGYFLGSITFGDLVLSSLTKLDETFDGYIVKLHTESGKAEWARRVADRDLNTDLYGVVFDDGGNVAVTGSRCSTVWNAATCIAFVALYAGSNGDMLWEQTFPAGVEPVADVDFANGKLYLAGTFTPGEDVLGLKVSELTTGESTHALLLVLDAIDGAASWAAVVAGNDGAESSLVKAKSDAVYFGCTGDCHEVRTTASETTIAFEGMYKGGLTKIAVDGTPLWAADLEITLHAGMVVTDTDVFVQFYNGPGTQAYGDVSFNSWGGCFAWGGCDFLMAKIDATTGAGVWVLQAGGSGVERLLGNLAADSNGDVYSVAVTWSKPAYFDPLIIDTHEVSDGYDMFVAKLRATAEVLPSCLVDKNTVVDGSCFVGNVCYSDGDRSRGTSSAACVTCSSADSKLAFTLAAGYCIIDGICYQDGTAASVCQYCNVSVSVDTWTQSTGDYDVAADGSCVARPTWTTQSPTIPQFDWVVIDHGNGSNWASGATVAGDAVFAAGGTSNVIRATNFETGEYVSTGDIGNEFDVHITKIALDGTPLAIWMYPGSDLDIVNHLSSSQDGSFIASVVHFAGNITFGSYTFEKKNASSSVLLDGVVVKLSAIDGNVAWARHFTHTGNTPWIGTSTFDQIGNVFFAGMRCDAGDAFGETCRPLATLLASEDGSTLWEKDFAGTGFDLFMAVAYAHDTYYLAGSISRYATVDGLGISTRSAGTDAVLLALDADGIALWACTVSGNTDASSNQLTAKDNFIYMDCTGSCLDVWSTVTEITLPFAGTHDGGVVKIGSDGTPLWTADLPIGDVAGIVATDDAVFVDYGSESPQTYGNTTFQLWGEVGSRDIFIAKINAETGAGEWVIQAGGQNWDYRFSNLALDANGDIYSIGATASHPVYFDPLVVDTHTIADGLDLMIAKLTTSQEVLPACKNDERLVAAGHCFINNVCYEDGTPARGVTTEACMICDASSSQTSFTISEGYCFIGGVCYADGAAGSTCQVCDVSVSIDSWTHKSDEYRIAADGSCVVHTTWKAQSAYRAQFDWIVLDQGVGYSQASATTSTKDAIFTAVLGVVGNTVATNPITGDYARGDKPTNYGVHLLKISLDGTPQSMWLISEGNADLFHLSIVSAITASPDESSLAITGTFFGRATFGNYTLVDANQIIPDGFVVKVSAVDGEVVWARHLVDTNSMLVVSESVMTFDINGDVFISELRCDPTKPNPWDTAGCVSVLTLLASEDGTVLWEQDLGEGIIFEDGTYTENMLYLSGTLSKNVTVGNLEISMKSEGTNGVLLVLDANRIVSWFSVISGDTEATGDKLEVTDDAVYLACTGCREVFSSATDVTVAFSGASWGGLAKIGRDGTPLWAADLPITDLGYSTGVAAAGDAVYVEYSTYFPTTVADTTIPSWGDSDVFILKIDKETAAGKWVLQVGGQGSEEGLGQLVRDANGDIYVTVTSDSSVLYFDPLRVEMQIPTTFAVAKLTTSIESLPSCKVDETTVHDGNCFVNNVCYDDGASSRTRNEACQMCAPNDSQTSFTTADGDCFIDGVCYAEGALRSVCQYCNTSASTTSWTPNTGITDITADGSCVARETWTMQSTMIPQFDWVVIDHGNGSNWASGATVAGDAVFAAGGSSNTLRATNFETGQFVTTSDFGNSVDVHITKIGIDGTPQAIWAYRGNALAIVNHLSPSRDGRFLSLVVHFSGGDLTFGNYTLTKSADRSVILDGAVVKLSATDGEVAWAQHFANTGNTPWIGTSAFDADGNVVFAGTRCETGDPSGETCHALVTLLASADGSIIWEKAIPKEEIRPFMAVTYAGGMFYLAGTVVGHTVLDDVVTWPRSGPNALLLALDQEGIARWAVTISGNSDSSSNQLAAKNDAIYLDCTGDCLEVWSTATDFSFDFSVSVGFAPFAGTHNGGIVKIGTDGIPIWTADLPVGDVAGIVATAEAVYIDYGSESTQTYGDTTFDLWGEAGSRDIFIAKLDAETGAGVWVLQAGGQEWDYRFSNLAIDANGDVYSVGATASHPVYFDPLVVDTHNVTDGLDLMIAKLTTSQETLPKCKTDKTTVTDGHCFVNNVCYEDGVPSRSVTAEACMACKASDSQTSFTFSETHCLIDDICYANGAYGSACQFCDVSVASDSWTLNAEEYRVAADGSCVARTTWTTQSATLPQFDWVVLDYGGQYSMGFAVTTTSTDVYVAGIARNSVTVTNAQTLESLESKDGDADFDLYVAKVSRDGKPQSIWLYPGGSSRDQWAFEELPTSLASSRDGVYIAMAGIFVRNVTFGDNTFTKKGSGRDGFVTKVAATDGTVAWARHIAGSGDTVSFGTTLDFEGNVAVCGHQCEVSETGDSTCISYVLLLASDDGSVLWERKFDAGIDLLLDIEHGNDNKFYMAGRFVGQVQVDNVSFSSMSSSMHDALLLVLDGSGTGSWAAMLTGSGARSVADPIPMSTIVKIVGDAVYFTCANDCQDLRTTASEATVSLPGQAKTSVSKINTDGVPLWIADIPVDLWGSNLPDEAIPLGIAATESAVYANFGTRGSQTYGDTVFTAWGSYDNYIAKIDAMTGAGEWVLQTGGHGLESSPLCNIEADSAGDVYSVGLTLSDTVYFDPFEVDIPTTAASFDLFVAKLKTSDENIPSCKIDENTIMDGYCFVNNICYEDRTSSRSRTADACQVCVSDKSQTSFSPDGYCHIDGACYADGEVGSSCQYYCDSAQSTNSWTTTAGCVIDGACYADGEVGSSCQYYCDAAQSTNSWTTTAGCVIDGACYANGAPRTLDNGVDSTCQYCDASLSTDAWSVRTGFSVSTDGITCVEDEVIDEDEDTPNSKVIAGYRPATNVSSHAKMDLDAYEIRDFVSQSDFDGALFVYENGGNGLCSVEDTQTTDSTDSCFGKTVDNAKGHSVSSSGSIRTIKGFATAGPSKMAEHKWYPIYRDYWSDATYADSFVQNALGKSGVWSTRSDAMRAELATKGAVFQAVWMYMLHEMEEAIVQCKAGHVYRSDTSSSAPHRWDEFWAFYAGSLEDVDGSGDGEFIWALAEKRCAQFATCDPRGRTALANERALELAITGLEGTLSGDCASVETAFHAIVDISSIPLVQGLLKYLYDVDPAVNGGSCTSSACTYDEEWGEGWAFAAALLPRLNECDPGVAAFVRENLDVDNGDGVPLKDGYRAVKAQLETTYACLGITCADVGAYQSFDGIYEGMEACIDAPPTMPTSKKKTTKVNHAAVIGLIAAIAVIIVLGVALAVLYVCVARKKNVGSTFRTKKTRNTLVAEIKDDASETTASDVTHLDIED